MGLSVTEFLLSIRSAYKSARLFLPEYLTFYVSSEIFNQYMNETKATANIILDSAPTKYMLKQIRVKEDERLSGMGIRIVEGEKAWQD